jgi:hypothetical protein
VQAATRASAARTAAVRACRAVTSRSSRPAGRWRRSGCRRSR